MSAVILRGKTSNKQWCLSWFAVVRIPQAASYRSLWPPRVVHNKRTFRNFSWAHILNQFDLSKTLPWFWYLFLCRAFVCQPWHDKAWHISLLRVKKCYVCAVFAAASRQQREIELKTQIPNSMQHFHWFWQSHMWRVSVGPPPLPKRWRSFIRIWQKKSRLGTEAAEAYFKTQRKRSLFRSQSTEEHPTRTQEQ